MAKIGIALSGGGMRGVGHLGVLDALAEFGIHPDIISGTSAGAICGAFYSGGYSSKEGISIIREGKIFHFNHIVFGQLGIYNIKSLEDIIQKYFPENTFEALPIPLHTAATDIINGSIVYFSSGTLSEGIVASACIPVIFTPIKYKDTLLVDGGVLNNFPIEPLIGKCDKIIGVHVNAITKNKEHIHIHNIMERSFHLALNNAVHQKVAKCDLFIEPPAMTKFNMFEQTEIEDIYDYAYEHTKAMKAEILKFKESL